MSKTKATKVVVLGCGNVAWHLARQLSTVKQVSLQVYNHKSNPQLTAIKKRFRCAAFAGFNGLPTDADYYIIAVSDAHIATVASGIKAAKPAALLVHTSGSMEVDCLGHADKQKAVLYPLQTFSISDEPRWKEIPIITEAAGKAALEKVKTLAAMFSPIQVTVNYRQRLHIHLAAVMVNNFTNALYAEALEVLNKGKLRPEISLLLPLIGQTVDKLKRLTPLEAQTGPARRNDMPVIKKHLALLKKQKKIKKMYSALTQLIKKQHA